MSWEWEQDDGEYEPYDDDIQNKLERALKKGQRKVVVDAQHYVELVKVPNEMFQYNKNDRDKVRTVRRISEEEKERESAADSTTHSVGEVLFGQDAYYPKFDLQNFQFQIELRPDNVAAFSFQFETLELQRKRGKNDDDDEEEDEDEEWDDDWKSREAWDNYGPGANCEWDFGSLNYPTKCGRLALSGRTLKFRDSSDEEALSLSCLDHQDTCSNSITFEETDDFNHFVLVWDGKLKMDGDEKKLRPFTIRALRAELVGITCSDETVDAKSWFSKTKLKRGDEGWLFDGKV